MAEQSKISERIRANVWAIAVCFAALTGTAIASGSGDEESRATTAAASPKKQIKKLKGRITALEQRLAGITTLEQRLAAVEGSQSPRPPTGPAGGELAGSYPNPTIGTVSGLDLDGSSTTTARINFGTDVNLFRLSSTFLKTDDSLEVGGNLQPIGNLTVSGDSSLGIDAADHTTIAGYLVLRAVTGTDPPAGDCDVAGEVGRMVYKSDTNELWVCDGAGGWLQILAS